MTQHFNLGVEANHRSTVFMYPLLDNARSIKLDLIDGSIESQWPMNLYAFFSSPRVTFAQPFDDPDVGQLVFDLGDGTTETLDLSAYVDTLEVAPDGRTYKGEQAGRMLEGPAARLYWIAVAAGRARQRTIHLEVLYIGKTLGADGERLPVERVLEGHSKLGEIAQLLPRDRELLMALLGYEFIIKDLAGPRDSGGMFPQFGIHELAARLAVDEVQVKKALVSVTEAVLVNGLDCRFNDDYTGSTVVPKRGDAYGSMFGWGFLFAKADLRELRLMPVRYSSRGASVEFEQAGFLGDFASGQVERVPVLTDV